MIYATFGPYKGYDQEELDQAVKNIEAKHPGWNLGDVYFVRKEYGCLIDAPATHHMKAKVREIYEEANRLKDASNGLNTFYVSVAIDARVDVRIKAKSLKEAMEQAETDVRNGCFDWDWNEVEVVGTSPVNISDENGELLKDF